MTISEKANQTQGMDENLKRLVHTARGLEETLLEYANYKPVKKVHTNSGEAKEKLDNDHSSKFKDLIKKIFEFK